MKTRFICTVVALMAMVLVAGCDVSYGCNYPNPCLVATSMTANSPPQTAMTVCDVAGSTVTMVSYAIGQSPPTVDVFCSYSTCDVMMTATGKTTNTTPVTTWTNYSKAPTDVMWAEEYDYDAAENLPMMALMIRRDDGNGAPRKITTSDFAMNTGGNSIDTWAQADNSPPTTMAVASGIWFGRPMTVTKAARDWLINSSNNVALKMAEEEKEAADQTWARGAPTMGSMTVVATAKKNSVSFDSRSSPAVVFQNTTKTAPVEVTVTRWA